MTQGVKDTAKQILRFRIELVGTAIELMHRIPLGRMGGA